MTFPVASMMLRPVWILIFTARRKGLRRIRITLGDKLEAQSFSDLAKILTEVCGIDLS